MNSARPQNTPVASTTNPSSSKDVRDEGRTALDFSIIVRAGLARNVFVDTGIPRKPLIQLGRAERLLRRRAPIGEVRARSGARGRTGRFLTSQRTRIDRDRRPMFLTPNLGLKRIVGYR